MPFSGKVSIRISRKKTDEQDERKAEIFLHWVGNAAYRIQISGVNGSSAMGSDFSLSILDCLMLQYAGLLKLKPVQMVQHGEVPCFENSRNVEMNVNDRTTC